MMQSRKIALTTTLLAVMATGCDVDKNHPKYDQLRYEELQKTRCVDMATMLSSSFVTTEPENYDKALKRCEDMKSLSFEEYKRLADHARASGKWDVYQLYPEKNQPKSQ
jgi:uncharacterized protein YutE (UPF0331/DUF86 family)